jgi:ACS family hexuronate transporter-like MFS transporter
MVLITKWYPPEHRGFVVTMHQALQSIGPVITAPLVAAITLSHGWRTSFIFPGVAGFALALVWFLADRAPMPPPVITGNAKRGGGFAAFRFVITSRLLRGVLLARVVTDPCWFFLIYWQAAFLQERGGWTLAELGRWTWLPPAVAAIGNVVVGLWSDRLLRKNSDAPTARRIALQRLVWLAPCLALAPFVVDHKAAVLALLVLAYFMANCWLTMINVLVTELAPAGTIATTLGTMSALGGASSIVFNYAAGPLVDAFGYTAMFIVCSCLHPLGAFMLYTLYRVRPVVPFPPSTPVTTD